MKPVLTLSIIFFPLLTVGSQVALNQDEVTLRQLVTKDYVTLWSKTESRGFSMDIARRIYLQDSSLRAIDTDIMQQPRLLYPSTRIRGATVFNQIWPKIFEDVEYFRALLNSDMNH